MHSCKLISMLIYFVHFVIKIQYIYMFFDYKSDSSVKVVEYNFFFFFFFSVNVAQQFGPRNEAVVFLLFKIIIYS